MLAEFVAIAEQEHGERIDRRPQKHRLADASGQKEREQKKSRFSIHFLAVASTKRSIPVELAERLENHGAGLPQEDEKLIYKSKKYENLN